jgi:hypothetical protein
MERRFWVYDGDGELLRTFLSKQDALCFMDKRPECKLIVHPKPKKPKELSIFDTTEEAPF